MTPLAKFMAELTALEDNYIYARIEHSITAQRCWKLRARLDQMGLTPERERELNERFGREMQGINTR
jgi:hypothetical protein